MTMTPSKKVAVRAYAATLIAFAFAFLLSTAFGFVPAGGISLALFWFTAALATRLSERSRTFAYPLVVIACVTTSMYFPWLYLEYFGVPTTRFVIPILQIIMFGMGTQLSLNDFRQVLVQPWGVLVGVAAQFLIMPIVGFVIAVSFPFPKEIAAGIILIGCVPCGIASNVMNFLARSNVALSITLTTVATLLGPIMTPLWMKGLIGESLALDYVGMASDITKLVIFPIMAGVLFHGIALEKPLWKIFAFQFVSFSAVLTLIVSGFSCYFGTEIFQAAQTLAWQWAIFLLTPVVFGFLLGPFLRNRPKEFERFLGLVSMFGLLLTIVFINAAGRDNLMKTGILLVFACLLHNCLGYFFGYWLARLCRFDEKSCRTISIEVGMQNGGLAAGLAIQMGHAATMGLAPAICSPLMNITGSSLATWWRGQAVTEENEKSS